MIVQRLDHGLTVIAKPVANKVVTLDAWVNTGSANENETLNGISHFLEHMLFKGTSRYGVGELDRAIMSVGGVWNAGTSKDYTHYYVTVASPFFAAGLDAISDMLQHASIAPEEFDKEKPVILEEYRRKQDNPWGMLYDELYALSFESGPYRKSVLGSFESISGLTREQMRDYYERYYSPENMVLMVVGDIVPEAVLAEVERAFGGFERPYRPLDVGEWDTRYGVGLERALKKDVNETYVGLSYAAPAIWEEEEIFALDIAATILGDGRSSRLYRSLKEDKRLVHSVSAGFPTHRYKSLFYVLATLDQKQLQAFRQETARLLKELAQAPPSPEEMAKAKRIITNQFHFSMETNAGQTETIGYYYTLTGSTRFLEQYLEHLNAVRPERICQVVQSYLQAEPNMVLLEPEQTEHASSPENHE